MRIKSLLLVVCVCFFSMSFFRNTAGSTRESKPVSAFGVYEGYSEEIYDSWVRSSQYLIMRDGIKLAIDIIRPAKDGNIEERPLPAVLTHTRYLRAVVQNGNVVSTILDSAILSLLNHGYIVAVADARGSGASFGSKQGLWERDETMDAYEIIEWLASRPWCDGNVGMFGASYPGTTQLMAASTRPPHLKAIFPRFALFDILNIGLPGGISRDDFIKTWSDLTTNLDTQVIAAPVDEDTNRTLLEAAVAEHKKNRPVYEIAQPLRFRDSRDGLTGTFPLQEWHPAAFVKEINESKVPMYLWCGWFDSYTKDGFLMYRNFTMPRRIVIGAWSHNPKNPEIQKMEFASYAVEQLRWFDYWLKGIDNGIMDEDTILYQVMKSPGDYEWRTAKEWPLPTQVSTKYYFRSGPTGSLNSVNDGSLSLQVPRDSSGADLYIVDYSTTTGTTTRWDNTVGGGFGYPDMTTNDKKGLTYTSPVLSEDVELTGHPVVHLWVSSTVPDGDFFAYLEEVDADGFSHYLTEGILKASYRKLREPPYDNLGLPYQGASKKDIEKLEVGMPTELVFDMHPTSNVFDAGNRIRITITCADKDNAETVEIYPPPAITLYRNAEHASYIILPIISEITEENRD